MKSLIGGAALLGSSTLSLTAEAQQNRDYHTYHREPYYHQSEHSGEFDKHGIAMPNEHSARNHERQALYNFDSDAIASQYWDVFGHNYHTIHQEEHYNQAQGDIFGMPTLTPLKEPTSPPDEQPPGATTGSGSGGDGGMSDLTSVFASSLAGAEAGGAGPSTAAPTAPGVTIGPDGKKKFPAFSCYKPSYFRGKGNGLYWCKDDEEKSLNLCYPKCKENWTGVGAFCYQDCPKDFKAMAVFCVKPKGYGRGAGSWSKCEDCEKWGLWWYKKCAEGFHASKVFWCRRDCPSGMADLMSTCKKNSSYRGLGHFLYCGPEQDQVGVWCWNKCKKGYSGVGPLCMQDCPAETTACGGVLCLTEETTCSQKFAEEIKNILDLVEKAMTTDVVGGVVDLASIAKGMTYPICRTAQ